jgi:protein phosphatase
VQALANTRVARLLASGASDKGTIRPNNEDCFQIDTDLQLFVVADGMGGHNAGEVAARLAVDTVVDVIANRAGSTSWPFGYDAGASAEANLLRTAVKAANARVWNMAAVFPQYSGMGTTVVAVLIRDNIATIAHVGDSRAYVVNAGQAVQLTLDDSWAAVIAARDPSLDADLLKDHPMRHALVSVVGVRPGVEVHVSEHALPLEDVLVLTTDGVHGTLSEHEMVRVCELALDIDGVAAGLVQAAIASGSRDNCTAVAIRYESTR